MEPVHERREALVVLAQPAQEVENARIKERVKAQEPALEPRRQVLAERVAQAISPDSGVRDATVRRAQGRNGADPLPGLTLSICSASSASGAARQWRNRNRVKGKPGPKKAPASSVRPSIRLLLKPLNDLQPFRDLHSIRCLRGTGGVGGFPNSNNGADWAVSSRVARSCVQTPPGHILRTSR